MTVLKLSPNLCDNVIKQFLLSIPLKFFLRSSICQDDAYDSKHEDEAWELEQREVVLQEVCELHKIDFIFQILSDVSAHVSGLVIVRPPYLCCSVCKHEVLLNKASIMQGSNFYFITCIFSILFSIHLLKYSQGEFVYQSRTT